MVAADVLRDAENDRNALNTAYSDANADLQYRFRAQQRAWREALTTALVEALKAQARVKYPQLRDWQPKLMDSSRWTRSPSKRPSNKRVEPTGMSIVSHRERDWAGGSRARR
jgi:hypothetical protein